MSQDRKIAQKWRDDNSCTLDGKPAKIVGWAMEFPIVAQMDSPTSCEFSWAAVNRIMERDRKFKS